MFREKPSEDQAVLGVSCDWYVDPNIVTVACGRLTSLQDIGQKYLHYVDSPTKFIVRDGIEDLPDRIDISTISEVATGTCAPYPHSPRDQGEVALTPVSPLHASQLSFALLTASGATLAAQIAPDSSRWADWTDGLNMIRRAGGHVSSPETDVFVQALTDIGLKIRLLSTSKIPLVFISSLLTTVTTDVSGDMVEVPGSVPVGPPPPTTDFFFSDPPYDAGP